MSPITPTLPVNPVVRFHMRTLLAAMTAAAVVLAIAGIYYRRQTVEAQAALTVYWSVIAAFFAVGAWHNWRTSWRVAPQAGTPRFMIVAPRPGAARRWRHWRWLLPCGMLLLIAFNSHQFAAHGDQNRELLNAAIRGLSDGLILALVAYAQLAQPTYLCDNGVSVGRTAYAPWKYVRHASWLPDRPTWLKLRRLDGDLFLEIPEKDRAAIEAFVGSKTQFKDIEPPPLENRPETSFSAHGQ